MKRQRFIDCGGGSSGSSLGFLQAFVLPIILTSVLEPIDLWKPWWADNKRLLKSRKVFAGVRPESNGAG